jgi:uncharacterized protein GlcG (DUF336 family)
MADKALSVSTITADFAEELVASAARASTDTGRRMVIAVVDREGTLKAFLRMDGAPLLSVEIAQNKAYTAAAFGMATHAWFDFIKGDEPLRLGIVHTERLVTFGGGYPIVVDGEVIGGIGVSGGHYTDDMEVAAAALEAAGLPTG